MPNDLARVVDALGNGAARGQRIVERGVVAAAVKEAVDAAAAVQVIPDDLALVVDALGNGAARAQGIVERGVVAAAVEEAVDAAAAVR